MSQQCHSNLRDVADEVVETGSASSWSSDRSEGTVALADPVIFFTGNSSASRVQVLEIYQI
jgi:hypothetical protein